MAKFTDKTGNVVDQINQENIEDFKQYLQTNDFSERGQSYSLYMGFDGVNFADLFTDKDGKAIRYPRETQIYLGRLIGTTRVSDKTFLNATANELLDMADEYPDVLKEAFSATGNFGNGDLFDSIVKVMSGEAEKDADKKRSISQNLPALLVLGEDYVHLGVGQAKGEPTKKDVQLFEKLYAKEKEKTYYAREISRKLAKTGYFVNSKLSSELRKEQNALYFEQLHIDELKAHVLKMDTKYFDKETVAGIVFGYGLTYFNSQTYGVTDSHGRVSDFDKKMQDILLTLAYKTEAHDKDNYGKEKTLNQRVKDLAIELWNLYSKSNVKSYEDIPYDNRRGIIADLYLKSAIYDLRDGRAADLDKDALQNILTHDKKGHYFKMMPREVINNNHLLLTPVQQELMFAGKEELSDYEIKNLEYHSHLSLKEKEEVLDRAAKNLDGRKQEKAGYQRVVEASAAEKVAISHMRDDFNNKNRATSIIRTIQGQYAKIIDNIQGDTLNSAEINLTKDGVNALLESACKGEKVALEHPVYGNLPLVFGRAKEEARRTKLNQEIDRFNELIEREVVKPTQKSDGKRFSDVMQKYAEKGLLSADVLIVAEKETTGLRVDVARQESVYKTKFGVNTCEQTKEKGLLDEILKKEKILTEAQSHLAEKKNALRETARNNVLPPKESPLKSAEGLSPEEKRAVRKANREVADPLKNREGRNAR